MSERGPDSDPGASDDRGAVRAATIGAAIVVAAFGAGKAARDAIVLRSFDIEWIPLFSGGAAVLSLPLVLAAGRALARFGPTRVLPWLNFLSAALLVGEWLLLVPMPRFAAALVYLHLGSLGAVLVSGFWSVANARLAVQGGKSQAVRLGPGATFGGIAAGAIAERTAVLLAPDAILLVLAGLQLACTVMVRGRLRPVVEREAVVPPSPWSAFGVVRDVSMLRYLAAVVVCGALGAAALDFVFKAEVKSFTHADPLRVFAIYQMGTSVIISIIQIGLVERTLTGIGPARAVSLLPLTLAGSSILSMAVPGLGSMMVARGSENVVRMSLYRTSYELLFAPLPDADKRSTKVLLDVGAERVGDLLGAQVVTLAIHSFAATRQDILLVAAVSGIAALAVAVMIPRAYTAALERSLVAHSETPPEPDVSDTALWTSRALPTVSEAGGDQTALSLLNLRISRIASAARRAQDRLGASAPGAHTGRPTPSGRSAKAAEPAKPATSATSPLVARPPDPLRTAIEAIEARDLPRVRELLAQPASRDLVPHVIPLLAWDTVAKEALAALAAAAPRCTGALIDALLDPDTDFTIRRRLPAAIIMGDPSLAAVGLTRGLDTDRFEVRYRCGKALRQLREREIAVPLADTEVYQRILKELSADATRLESYRLLDPEEGIDPAHMPPPARASTAIAHTFNLLALVLSPAAVQTAYASLHGDDVALRATVREYLDSALPSQVFAQLWEVIETVEAVEKAQAAPPGAAPAEPGPASSGELIAAARND